MKKELKNYAFIDAQNLYLGVKNQNWQMDYAKLRQYLADKYDVKEAYLFIGYITENNDIYAYLQKAGFILIFKETLKMKNELIKGNVDAELVLQTMIEIENFDQAIIITGDGDFACLIKYLYNRNKLKKVIVPNMNRYSVLIKKTAKEKITSITELKDKLENNTDKD